MKSRVLGAVAALMFPTMVFAQASRPATYITADQVKTVNALPGVDRQIVNFHEAKKNTLAVTRLVAEYQKARSKHRLEVRLILEPTGINGQRLRKEILLDGVKKPANEIIGHFNAVIFVPQMSQIIEGAPEDRRRYLNLALAQSTPAYARVLSEYKLDSDFQK